MAATKIKVIELAKELGVTSKDLMLAAEEMGHKGVRAMTPLDAKLANDLRTKLGKGRELPEEPAKPKRVAKPKAPVELGPDGTPIAKKPARAKKGQTVDAEEGAVEIKPAATIVKPKPLEVASPTPPVVAKPPEIAPEPSRVAPAAPAPPVEPVRPAAAAAPAVPAKPEPKIVPFRPLERPAPPPSRPSRHPAGPFAPPRVTQGPPRPAAPLPPPRPSRSGGRVVRPCRPRCPRSNVEYPADGTSALRVREEPLPRTAVESRPRAYTACSRGA